ncbi:hypothetical protein [Escherichia coli]|uniref:hypothetical protein n=1 Tax=Escherichia coli TaxID=562 RepID=UPI0038B329E2
MNPRQLPEYLAHAVRSGLGLYLLPFSPEWDEQLSRLLAHGRVVNICPHAMAIHLHGVEYRVWTASRWYNFGYLYGKGFNGHSYTVPVYCRFRPRFRTMLALYERYTAEREEREKHGLTTTDCGDV